MLKCIEVYEESHTSVKQILLIVMKFYIMPQLRISNKKASQ